MKFYLMLFYRNKNARGQLFGLAQFANVRDMEKLSKALNNVYFAYYKMYANVARHDRFEKFGVRNMGLGVGKMSI